MSLKVLEIDDHELPIDVLDVEIPEINEMEEMELPDGFRGEEIKDQVETIQNLTSISLNLALEGIDQSTARDLDNYIPGFYQKHGGGRTFTPYRSIEGLSPALEAIEDEKKSTIARFVEWLKARTAAVLDWLKNLVDKFKKREQDMSAINEFLAEQRNVRAFDLLEQRNLSSEEASAKLLATIGIGGDNLEEIRAGLIEHLDRVKKNVDSVRNPENKTSEVYDLVLTNKINISPAAITELYSKLDSILSHCNKAMETMAVGDTMSNSQMRELEEMVSGFKESNAIFLSDMSSSKADISANNLALSIVKRNVDSVQKTFGQGSAARLTDSVKQVMQLQNNMVWRDEKASEFNTSGNVSAKPVADALSALMMVTSRINQINSATGVISSRLAQAMKSYISALMYIHGKVSDEDKQKVTKFCLANGVNIVYN